jgi:hypothetical protein
MTNQLVSKFSGTLLAFSLVSSSFGQKVKILPAVTIEASTPIGAVNTKIGNSFNEDFKDAVGVTWYKLNKNYLVTFISGNMKNDALYRKNGVMVYNVGYGKEENLPKDVRAIVKSQYYGYSIVGILKVNQDEREVWIVNMEDDKKLIITSVEDGVMNVMHNYEMRQ